jgi:CBS domain-containing protein
MGKSVKDAMTANPCTIDADQTVSYAARMLKDEDVGLAPVVEGQRLVGTLTDRDIVTRVVAEGKDPQTVKVRDVASSNLVTVDPQQDLDEALRLMASHQVRRLPVVEEDGRVVGVLAQADVAEHAKEKKVGEMVEEISQS